LRLNQGVVCSINHARKNLSWSSIISKINYKIHTDAIKENLIPKCITTRQKSVTYAGEADMLNVALFGKTAKEWRKQNPDTKGNMRDKATLQQLIVLSNMESMNAELIKQSIAQKQRLVILNKMAIEQMLSIMGNAPVKKLGEQNNEL
jgi:hypothetical protein